MNTQKLTKKEKIEKVINALSDCISQYGYFIIQTKDICIVYGKKFQLDYVLKEPYIYVIDEKNSNNVYGIIKLRNIQKISPIGIFF